jgi:hypothetical protein
MNIWEKPLHSVCDRCAKEIETKEERITKIEAGDTIEICIPCYSKEKTSKENIPYFKI